MIRILAVFFLFAISIVVFEGTLNEFQDSITISSAAAEVSETLGKADTFSNDEEIVYPYTVYNDFFALIDFISKQPENSLHNISNKILQPPR